MTFDATVFMESLLGTFILLSGWRLANLRSEDRASNVLVLSMFACATGVALVNASLPLTVLRILWVSTLIAIAGGLVVRRTYRRHRR